MPNFKRSCDKTVCQSKWFSTNNQYLYYAGSQNRQKYNKKTFFFIISVKKYSKFGMWKIVKIGLTLSAFIKTSTQRFHWYRGIVLFSHHKWHGLASNWNCCGNNSQFLVSLLTISSLYIGKIGVCNCYDMCLIKCGDSFNVMWWYQNAIESIYNRFWWGIWFFFFWFFQNGSQYLISYLRSYRYRY